MSVNAVLNGIRSGLSILFPLITYPYAFRVLKVEGIGKVNYSLSIVNFFILFAGLGISTYAVREGAKVKNDRKEIEKFSSEIFSINIFSMFFSYFSLALCMICINKFRLYTELIIIQSISIFFVTIGVEWINSIYEDYVYIVIRSIVIYIINFVVLFLFVRTPEDYRIYAFLTVSMNVFTGLLNFIYCRKYVSYRFTTHLNLKKHINSILVLFENQLAITVYVNADTTMLGWICGDYYVGLYECSVKVYTVIKKILSSLYIVSLPRLSEYYKNGNLSDFNKTFTRMISILTLLIFPCSVGLFVTAKDVVMIIGGAGFEGAVFSLKVLSIALIGALLGGLFTVCINIPICREKMSMKATLIAATINIILNILIIPKYHQNGAAITTLISEYMVLAFCIISTKDLLVYFNIHIWMKYFFHSLVGAISVAGVAHIANILIDGVFIKVLLIFVFSCALYGCELYILKNETINSIADSIKRKLMKVGK